MILRETQEPIQEQNFPLAVVGGTVFIENLTDSARSVGLEESDDNETFASVSGWPVSVVGYGLARQAVAVDASDRKRYYRFTLDAQADEGVRVDLVTLDQDERTLIGLED